MLARSPDYIRIETLEEENRQLRAQIAALQGRDMLGKVRRAFGFTEAEGIIVCVLMRNRFATYETLQDAVYSDGRLCEMDDPSAALRAHMKRIRRKTRPHGVDFKTVYSMGFEMSEASFASARETVRFAGYDKTEDGL